MSANKPRMYLGIDPGIEITGFGIISVQGAKQTLLEYGVIRTSKNDTLPERLQTLHTDLSSVLEKYQGQFTAAGVEELFFAKNVKTAFVVGQARGVILFTLQSFGITIQEVKPVEVKAAVVGNGRADKKEVQKMIQLLFQLDAPPTPDDAADAVAIAITTAALVR